MITEFHHHPHRNLSSITAFSTSVPQDTHEKTFKKSQKTIKSKEYYNLYTVNPELENPLRPWTQSTTRSPVHPSASISTLSHRLEAAVAGCDLYCRRGDASLFAALGSRELVELRLAELEDRRVVDRDHVDRGLTVVLQLPARAAKLRTRTVNCAGKKNLLVSLAHPSTR